MWIGAAGLIALVASRMVRQITGPGRTAATPGRDAGTPPLAGSVANFTPFDSPRPAPQIAIIGGDGASLGLDALKGRPVLLNLWATWCVPCVREMASLDRLQESLGASLQVVALSEDAAGAKAVQPFFKEKGISHLGIYLDPSGSAAAALKVEGLPTTFMLDAGGRLVGRLVGPAEWDSPEALNLIRWYVQAE